MRRSLLLAGLLALAACSQAPVPPGENAALTAQRLNTAADNRVIDVALHQGQGAVYTLSNTVRTLNDGSYSSDAYLSRYSRDGAAVWQRQLGPNGGASAKALAADAGGNVFVRYNDRLEKRRSDGSLAWSRAQGGSDASALATAPNGDLYAADFEPYEAIVLRKYAGSGSLLWTRDIPNPGLFFNPSGLGTDALGNVYLAAYDMDDAYIMSYLFKYGASGKLLLEKTLDAGTKDLRVTGLEVQGEAVYLSGTSHTNWIGDPDNPTEADAFVAKLSLGGAELWRRVFGTAALDGASDLSTDTGGNLYVTGSTLGRLGGAQPGGSDVFLRKYTPGGNALWTKQIGSAGDDLGHAVAVYSSSELYLGGEVGGALAGRTYRGGQDGFLRRTDGSGNRVWIDQ